MGRILCGLFLGGEAYAVLFAVVLVLLAFFLACAICLLAIAGINEQVEGVVVVFKVVAVVCRHRTPDVMSTVVLVGRIVVATVVSGCGAIVGLDNQLVVLGTQLFAVIILLGFRYQVSRIENGIRGNLDGAGADICLFHLAGQRVPFSR